MKVTEFELTGVSFVKSGGQPFEVIKAEEPEEEELGPLHGSVHNEIEPAKRAAKKKFRKEPGKDK